MFRTHAAAAPMIADDMMMADHTRPAGLVAANDNEDERFDTLALDVIAILLRDGRQLLAG